MKKRTTNALEETNSRRKTSVTEGARGVAIGKAVETKEAGLQEQISALEAELAVYREALKNSREDMQAFAYSVSHDLKAPLRAIEGFSRILLDDFSAELNEDAQRFIKHIVANAETLSSQIEDLLKYYRCGKNTPARIPVDLQGVCAEIISTLPPEEGGRAKIVGELPTVLGDAVQLREVFAQLIGNALKFSKNARNPTVEISAAMEKDATRISVRDFGVGFDPKHATKLFQVFQKLHAGTEFPGNGIGLAIVKRLVLAHGGCVEADAAPQEGATFTVTLPRAGATALSAAAKAPESAT
jgi:light-regulated signal transduction histidine kinase (bacteriophytochrome)